MLPTALAAAAFLAALATGSHLCFYTILNDFWGTFFLGEHLSLADTRTLHNGFFPPGYPLVLRLLLSEDILLRAYVLTALSAAATLWVTVRFGTSIAWPWAAAGAGMLLALHPLFFLYGITTGPDAPTLALSTTGLLLLLTGVARPDGKRCLQWCVLGGLLLGAAGLLRHHGFPFAVASLLAVLVAWPSRWKLAGAAAAAAGAMVGVQAATNLMAGAGAFESAQAFNVYKTFNPVDWFHLNTNYPDRVLDVIRLSPERFLQAWWTSLSPALWLIVPAATAVAACRQTQRRMAVCLVLILCLYLPVQAVGGSPRGPLLVLPVCALGAALTLDGIRQRLGAATARPQLAIAVLVVIAFGVAALRWIPENVANVRTFRAVADLWRTTEAALRADGVQSPSAVFTDSFDFYFTTVRSARTWDYRPRNTGGWAQIDLYGYHRLHPPIDTSSLPAFLDGCRAQGITHLVLLSTAGLVLEPLGRIHAGGELPDGLRHVTDLPGIRIVALDDGRMRQ